VNKCDQETGLEPVSSKNISPERRTLFIRKISRLSQYWFRLLAACTFSLYERKKRYEKKVAPNIKAPNKDLGTQYRGCLFFLGTSFFGQAKKKCLAGKRRNQNQIRIKTSSIDWILACASMTRELNYFLLSQHFNHLLYAFFNRFLISR
jgi:hypothetical protein